MKQFIIWPLDYSGGISFFGANILFNPFDMEICSGAVTYMKIQDSSANQWVTVKTDACNPGHN